MTGAEKGAASRWWEAADRGSTQFSWLVNCFAISRPTATTTRRSRIFFMVFDSLPQVIVLPGVCNAGHPRLAGGAP